MRRRTGQGLRGGITLIAIALLGRVASAQPGPDIQWTLEARIAQAESVVVAHIATLSANIIVREGGIAKEGYMDPNGRTAWTVRVQVDEILKGSPGGQIGDLKPVEALGFDRRWQEWETAKTQLLLLIGPPEKGGRTWTWIRLGESVEDQRIFYDPLAHPPILAMNRDILKDGNAVLRRAREYAKSSKGVQQVYSMGEWNKTVFPVDSNLEALALEMISTPENVARSMAGYPGTRLNGADSLRFFKSPANASLLRSLLADSSGGANENGAALQAKAFEVLLDWNEPCELPSHVLQVNQIQLQGTNIRDADVLRLGAFTNLKDLNLTNTKVSAAGIRGLSGLKRLVTLWLTPSQLTDSIITGLGEMGMLHTIDQAWDAGQNRPPTEEKISDFGLAWSQIGNEALKPIGKLHNLTWLDLRDTKVSDAGLKELIGLTKLRTLFLGGTRVTRAGVAKLKRALPKCDIRWPSNSSDRGLAATFESHLVVPWVF